MSIIPVNNIINVTITSTPSGLTERNVNSLALFTNEATTSLNDYEIYISASQVAENYGTNSVTAKMANAIFAQTPNLRSGDGRLVIIPLINAVSATGGDFASADISANLADIIATTDGDLRVVIDGVDYDLTNLNFAAASDFDDVATILNGKLINATVTATANGIEIASHTVGEDSEISLAAVAGGTGTAMEGAGYFNGAGGTETAGVNSSGETILEAIARTSGSVGYVPVITNLNLENDAVEAIADGVQALDNMFLQHASSTVDIAGLATSIQQQGNKKTRILVFTGGQEEANLMKAAAAGRGYSVNFSGSLTSQTLNLKQLATISPDLGISQTDYINAKTAGADLYVSIDGVPSYISNGGNDFFDNVYSDLALKFALETAGFNFLRQTNTKVPQTEDGMNGLKAAYGAVCERFVRNGVIAGGSWTTSETFGDPEIFKQNVLDEGYYIYSLPIILQSAVEREEREAPIVQIAIKRAGAIHEGDVLVLVND